MRRKKRPGTGWLDTNLWSRAGHQSGFVGRHVLKPLTAAESQSRVDSGKLCSTWHIATRRPPAPLRAGSEGESVTRSSYGYATNDWPDAISRSSLV
jgi:hypothetical protein